jgi:hypothetical protein
MLTRPDPRRGSGLFLGDKSESRPIGPFDVGYLFHRLDALRRCSTIVRISLRTIDPFNCSLMRRKIAETCGLRKCLLGFLRGRKCETFIDRASHATDHHLYRKSKPGLIFSLLTRAHARGNAVVAAGGAAAARSFVRNSGGGTGLLALEAGIDDSVA